MAIKDVTQELEDFRVEKKRNDRIDNLGGERAAFALKILLLADHISICTLERSLDIAETVVKKDPY